MFHKIPKTAVSLLALLLLSPAAFAQNAAPKTEGTAISYQLPATGPLPKTYRVTLAITDPKNPDWIVSTFAAGVARTVTAENKGKFTEAWNGLDENFMPVPPGDYGVKGIYMPAEKWRVDGEFHSVTPKFVTGASAWMPSPEDWKTPEPFGGDPVGSPLADVAVGPDGVGVFYYRYLENGTNNPLFDLKKPIGLAQFQRAFGSGGAAGGTSVTTDGQTVWAFSTDGGPKYIYRADQKSFGTGSGANRSHVYLPSGWVTALANWQDAQKQPFVYVAERGKIVPATWDFSESTTDFVDKITVLDGNDGKILAELPVRHPQALAVRGNVLYVLYEAQIGLAVSSIDLKDGRGGDWQPVFAVPKNIRASDMEIDSHGRFYFSDAQANKVFQLDRTGKLLRTFGKLNAQKPGSYDSQTFMAPGKLATWTDAQGNDRLLVVEDAGPNRVTEWSSDGAFLREFLSLQTKANDGYTFDPEHPEDFYIPGQGDWLTRFKVDFAKRTWTVDAVWPHVGNDLRAPGLQKPQFMRVNGQVYLAAGRSFNVYRLDGNRWMLSAAILRAKDNTFSLWHDANGNNRVDDAEITPTILPGGVLAYHGQNWLDDLSFVAIGQGSRDVWRLTPEGFDAHGNPIFKTWQKLLSDPIFAARAENKADAVHGGNELANEFSSDWMQADGSVKEGFYIQARGGRGFDANSGAQYKISRYVPTKGGYDLKWRVGRAALQGVAAPGEMYGAMRLHRPINGLLAVVDQTRMGILLYTEDGLYVDTLFPDSRRLTTSQVGVYAQPGEFFMGTVVPNRSNNKIYFALGKYTPMLFEAEGWSLKENPVKPLLTVQSTVSLSAAQTAAPPEIALTTRGGAGTARVARFSPALGGAALDGSMNGWTSSSPITFQSDKDQTVEARVLYDAEHLYLRWHARLATPFEPKPLPPAERTFTHEQKADTLSFYIQGDPAAKPGSAAGRPGDARLVFGLFKDGETLRPVAVGFYPQWKGADAHPQNYRTPVGQTSFAHVGPIPDARLGYALDEDGKGFVIAAAIPRAGLLLQGVLNEKFRTLVNFEATFGGHNKFWWANSDGSASHETYDEPTEARLYPGSWAPAQLQGLEIGVVVRNWQILGPFGGPGTEKFSWDPNGVLPGTGKNAKDAVREFFDAAKFPPDNGTIDLTATYSGEQIQGYWKKTDAIQWRPATLAELDTRVIIGGGGQLWYGATWIRVPQATELDFEFQSHQQTYLRWSLNDQVVEVGPYKSDATEYQARTTANKTLTLQAGWNRIAFRGYCTGYSPFRAGLILKGAPQKLWTLQLSGTPPKETP